MKLDQLIARFGRERAPAHEVEYVPSERGQTACLARNPADFRYWEPDTDGEVGGSGRARERVELWRHNATGPFRIGNVVLNPCPYLRVARCSLLQVLWDPLQRRECRRKVLHLDFF
ncbi:Molybdenum ABC transporter, periplasmic molybdate-binding protein [Rhodococcus sp. AW25M09]|nr:Molybdenum ABC transporter, periplasmic molybdate-binding protein [Rhodococcus sp. AW25M09]